jgi:hypothetical protein
MIIPDLFEGRDLKTGELLASQPAPTPAAEMEDQGAGRPEQTITKQPPTSQEPNPPILQNPAIPSSPQEPTSQPPAPAQKAIPSPPPAPNTPPAANIAIPQSNAPTPPATIQELASRIISQPADRTLIQELEKAAHKDLKMLRAVLEKMDKEHSRYDPTFPAMFINEVFRRCPER